jgi:hypothetical protein
MKAFVMKILPYLLVLLLLPALSPAQRIFYSNIEKDDYRQMDFEIIGKVGGNINIYKNYKSKNDISVYDVEMKLKNKVRLEFLPDKISNVDFVVYPDFYHMVYQYQKKNVIYCASVKLNGEGKVVSDPVVLDTSHVRNDSEVKVYSMIASEDKKHIMIYKVFRRNDRFYTLTTLLYDKDLGLQRKSIMTYPVDDREGVFNEFVLDNDGDLAFGRSSQQGGRDVVSKFTFIVKKAQEDTLRVYRIPMKDIALDEVKIRPDNANERFILSSFYYKSSKPNIEGLYTIMWDKPGGQMQAQYLFPFGDTLRLDARTDKVSPKVAFNDYFIRNLIPTREGGFAVVTELYYTNSRTMGWNRWDYMYGYNAYMPYNYSYFSPYNPYNSMRWSDPWNRYGNNIVRHYAENIMIFFFNKDGNLVWSNTIQKRQFDDNTDMFLSYNLFNTGSEVRFLYNQLERRELMLNSATVNAQGNIKRDPTLKGLNKEYDFMPRYGKQVGLREIVLPCMNRNFICFAKLDF